MNRTRLVLGSAGVLLAGYGAWRILTTARLTRPLELGTWLIGALILHDALLAPAAVAVAVVYQRVVARRAPRAARYLAGALIVAAMATIVAIPLIHRRGHTPTGSTLETRDYGGALAVVIGIVAGVALLAYAVRVVRDRQG